MPETLPIKTRLCGDCKAIWSPDEHDLCRNCGKAGLNHLGEPWIKYDFSDPDDPTDQKMHPDFLGAIVFTGPMNGTVALPDGATYDITEPYIHCLPEHRGPIACAIHRMHNAAGTPEIPPHVHSDFCGSEFRSPGHLFRRH